MTLLRRILATPATGVILEIAAIIAIFLVSGILAVVMPAWPSAQHSLPAQLCFTALFILVLVVGVRIFERLPPAEDGLTRPHAIRDFFVGTGIGAFGMSAIIAILALAGWYRISGTVSLAKGMEIFAIWIPFYLAGATFEEIFFRGIILRLLERGLGSWVALVVSSLFFGLSHLTTPHATLWGAIAVALTAGLAAGSAYLWTRSLWPIIGAHFAWNLCESTIFGAPISGNTGIPMLMHATIQGPAIWTGGIFGPEASVMTVLLGMVLSGIVIRQMVIAQQIRTPAWWMRLTGKSTGMPRQTDVHIPA